MRQRLSRLSKIAGPGILFACTAIGVSHLVQSTRAGADYGLLMLGFVVLVSALKYPFFEYGSRYAVSTGTSIIDGYSRMGRPALWMYFGITASSMFFVTGAVGFVAAGFFENLFGLDIGAWAPLALFGACIAILAVGRYSALDGLIKVIGAALLVSTTAAFILAVYNGPVEPAEDFIQKELFDTAGIFFLLALMGWMPTAIDLSSWNSLWTLERIKQIRFRPKLGEVVLEFKLAYVITVILAVMFVVLGSLLLHGSGEELPGGSSEFAHRVVMLYTVTIGEWSHVIIAASAFTIMFGTVIAVLDGYSRSIKRTAELVFSRDGLGRMYIVMLFVVAGGALVVILQFKSDLKALVDFATVLSFVVAPVIGVLNLRLVTGGHLPEADRPSRFMRGLSIAGILFLSGFAAVFVVTLVAQ